ncbi:MAG: ABC transporter permease [Chloroflexi bacterium]|nr:ABC transporter permease [Chloroflexota bacterium]
MSRALRNVGWRYLLRHPWQTVLMIVGITLGVAVMVAIDLANSAASRAFDLSTDAIAGRATHQIVGGPTGLDETLYARLRTAGAIRDAAPIVTDFITSPQLGGRPIQLLGVDPFAEAPFRSYLVSPNPPSPPSLAGKGGVMLPSPDRGGVGGEVGARGGAGGEVNGVAISQLISFLTQPGALLISEGLATDYGLKIGDRVALDAGGRQSAGFIAGLLHPADALSRRALDGLILADIATAQEITGRVGRLDHIDLILREADLEGLPNLRGLLPPDAQIVPVAVRSGALAEMTAAFRTNLTALSLLALVVGMFLIYNSMTFSVVQRRPLFGTLRCLGVTQGEVGVLVLSEAAVVGAIGVSLGLGLGVLLGQGAVRLVTQTINDLYFVVTVRGVTIAPESLVKGALLGMAATLASASLPAWEAAIVPPRLALARSGLEETARRGVPITAAAGLIGLAAGGGLLAIPTKSLVISFAGIFFVTIGFALLSPVVTLGLLGGVTPVTSRLFGVLGRMAPRSVTGALSRTAIAIASLMIAVSVTVGVGLMVGSFRTTVVSWLGQTLRGDIYVSAPGVTATRSSAPLDPAVLDVVAQWPAAARWDVLRSVDVSSPAGPVAVAAVSDQDFTRPRIFVSTDGSRADLARAVQNGAVLASEPLAVRLNLPARGAVVTLFTDRGPQAFPVAGIYRDYSNSQGTVMMALDLYRSFWADRAVTASLMVLRPGESVDANVRGLQDALAGGQAVLVRPNAALRDEALAIFDRAFAITGALQLLAAAVAFIGVLSALLSLQLERGRELGLLRAIGLTVRQIRGVVLLETGLMGAVAGVLALPTGLALALILIYIINRRSFGWTLQLHADPAIFIQAVILAIVAALLAGVYPAIRMGRMMAAEALRGE